MNTNRIKRLTLGALLVTALASATVLLTSAGDDDNQGGQNDENTFSVALWGDMPYIKNGTPWTTELQVTTLISDINKQKVAFSVFDGDIKSGSSFCDNSQYSNAVARFNALKSPAVYVPGDNEWTDCHRKNNAAAAPGYNALERLSYIRTTMFNSVNSFGQKTMKLDHQGLPGQPYSENTRWVKNHVMFVGLNIPGSDNNYITTCIDSKSYRTQPDCDADNLEYAERNARNLEWIQQSFTLAKQNNVAGIMFVIQADPGFDIPETAAFERHPGPSMTTTDPTNYQHFTDTLKELRAQTVAYSGQVVLVHGDTHAYTVDKPLLMPFPADSPASPDGPYHALPNFTRVETFGESNADWIRVTVDARTRNVFRFEPMIVPGNH